MAIYERTTETIIFEVELDGFYCLWALITVFRTSFTRDKIGMIFFSDECIRRISLGMGSDKKKNKNHTCTQVNFARVLRKCVSYSPHLVVHLLGCTKPDNIPQPPVT